MLLFVTLVCFWAHEWIHLTLTTFSPYNQYNLIHFHWLPKNQFNIKYSQQWTSMPCTTNPKLSHFCCSFSEFNIHWKFIITHAEERDDWKNWENFQTLQIFWVGNTWAVIEIFSNFACRQREVTEPAFIALQAYKSERLLITSLRNKYETNWYWSNGDDF